MATKEAITATHARRSLRMIASVHAVATHTNPRHKHFLIDHMTNEAALRALGRADGERLEEQRTRRDFFSAGHRPEPRPKPLTTTPKP